MLNDKSKQQLLRLARFSIKRHFLNDQHAVFPETLDTSLEETLATFVTLKINHALRGCIGNMEATSTLAESVMKNAHSAAFHDPRFAPLSESEFTEIEISISILNQAQPVLFSSETDLLSKLRPNIDGLVIQKGLKKATFLPAVWESLTSPEIFLSQLKHKAGINEKDCPEQAWTYQTESFSE